MRHIGFLLVAVALAFGAPQQKAGTPPPSPEIRGVVLEPGINQPVVEAEVTLSVQGTGPVLINGGWKQDDARKATTDHSGAFRLSLERPGRYRVEAKKPGYAASDERGASDYAELTLTAEKPAAEVKLFLTRPGQLTGSVVDAETREPIVNLRLSAVRKTIGFGFLPVGDTSSRTDAEGRFAATGLQPGEYAVVVGPQIDPDKRVLTKFTAQDVKSVKSDYERTYWPGGHGPEEVLPMTLASGGTVDIGQLQVRKVPYYSVLVRIPVSNCGDGDTMRVTEATVTQTSIGNRPLAQVPCGKDVLVTGFSPGNYRLRLSIDDRTSETLGEASVPFSIGDENIEIAAPLTPGVTLEGAVVAAEGAKPPDFAKLKISLYAVDVFGSAGGGMPTGPGPDGKFRIANLRLLGHTVFVSGLGPANYVKELRYNGIPLSGDTVPLDQAALARTLTIVVDDKPGTITGAVVSGDKPVSRPFIMVRKWPPRSDQPTLVRSDLTGARGDDMGRFQVGGLAPGEYRIIALGSLEPGMSNTAIERALAAGEKIELVPSGFKNVTLEPTELR